MRDKEFDEVDLAKIYPEDKNWCWKALKYTKPKTNSNTPALKSLNNKVAVTIQDKNTLVKTHAFPKAPNSQRNKLQLGQGFIYLLVCQETEVRTLLS